MDDPSALVARGGIPDHPVEDFGPVWNSARLRIARASWQTADASTFVNFAVPYVSTSSGVLSGDMVEILLAARPDGPLRVLELGSGSGVFARVFLTALAARAPGRFAQTTYVLSDASPSILATQMRSGVVAGFEDRLAQRPLDATAPWAGDLGRFDAIIATYVFDSLPFDFLHAAQGRVWRREVRSCLHPDDAVSRGALMAALASADADLGAFAGVGTRMAMQTRHVEADPATLSYPHALWSGGSFTHGYGALGVLDRAMAHLRPGGVFMLSDYGHAEPDGYPPEFQCYGTTVTAGVNFGQIAAHAAHRGWQVFAPAETEGHLLTRVIRAGDGPDLSAVVEDRLGADRHATRRPAREAARELLTRRAIEPARRIYARALEAEPFDWDLHREIAHRLLLPQHETLAARDLLARALTLNPLSVDLRRALAAAWLALGDPGEAAAAVAPAAALAPRNPALQAMLAEIALAQEQPDSALLAVALGLAADHDGDWRDVLTSFQDRAVAAILKRQLTTLRAQADAMRPTDRPPSP
jgi:tetratricopeptide (TPR) repeat protein